MTNKKRISGRELDVLIESELLAMEREGLEKAPITPTTLHSRLKSKGIVSGGVSTLSVPHRKHMIDKYRLRQHHLSNLTNDEIELVSNRRTSTAYINRANRIEKERDDWKDKYQENLFAVLDIIKTVQAATPIKVEDLLSPCLLRELHSAPKGKRESKPKVTESNNK
ncbi:hypothetical protein [Oceanisphaera sp. IT1-181]|uniref:hypothetical protein n=1 Tax=Oceanisphaera sp. IT1-181 TaxID=3081199 RepID=UPI0029CA691A|nr:hypothetical protein [Oceanisphaera sp. IT1-181]